MKDRLAAIARCLDLRDEDVAAAVQSRAGTKALLERLAAVSARDTGVAKVLLVFARMATTACAWLDGDLRVDLTSRRDATSVEASTELGGGLLEREIPPMTFRAPIEEFGRAIDRVPRMIAPLTVRTRTAGKIILSATAAIRRTSVPPPVVEISNESLFVAPAPSRARAGEERSPPPLPVVDRDESSKAQETVPPEDLDEGWDG